MRLTMAAALAAGLLVAGCGAPERIAAVPRPTPTPAANATAAPNTCSPPATASYPPSTLSVPDGSTMAKIQEKKQLVVGISADSRLLGSRNLATGQFQGIDIEMANRVAQALFGNTWRDRLVFKTISASDRIPFLKEGKVDMVARAMTMTCARWNDVSFSTPYFVATQKVLIRKGAKEDSLAALAAAKKRVCATNGSTSIARLRAEFSGATAVGVPLTTDCLVLWQRGQVDAITGDDAILAGLAQQDPSADVPRSAGVGAEPYGLAVKKESRDFVAFLNALLERMRGNGDWQRAYASSGLQAVLGDTKTQPPADYSRK